MEAATAPEIIEEELIIPQVDEDELDNAKPRSFTPLNTIDSLALATGSMSPVTSSVAPSAPKQRSSLASAMWSFMRQQVFLGMVASSVPVKAEVNDLAEGTL